MFHRLRKSSSANASTYNWIYEIVVKEKPVTWVFFDQVHYTAMWPKNMPRKKKKKELQRWQVEKREEERKKDCHSL